MKDLARPSPFVVIRATGSNRVSNELIPARPDVGAPCNGCGWCCQQEVCGLGREVLADAVAPCPFLKQHDGRFWCGVIEEAERADVAFGGHMKWRLGIGVGCYAAPESSPDVE